MGNTINQQSYPKTLTHYKYIQTKHEEPFGLINIFKKKLQNFDYIIVLNKIIDKGYKDKIIQQIVTLGKKKHGPFLKIFQVVNGNKSLFNRLKLTNNRQQSQNSRYKQLQLIQSAQTLGIVMQYSNYTLKDHLQYTKRKNEKLSLSDYAYIIKQSIFAALIYEEHHFNALSLNISTLSCFITHNGDLKFLPFKSQFIKDKISNCDMLQDNCCRLTENTILQHHNASILNNITNYSKINPINSQTIRTKGKNKYIMQIKILSQELLQTLNIKQIANHQSTIKQISKYNIQKDIPIYISSLHNKIYHSKSLKEMLSILSEVQDYGCVTLYRENLERQSVLPNQHFKQENGISKIKQQYIKLQKVWKNKQNKDFHIEIKANCDKMKTRGKYGVIPRTMDSQNIIEEESYVSQLTNFNHQNQSSNNITYRAANMSKLR